MPDFYDDGPVPECSRCGRTHLSGPLFPVFAPGEVTPRLFLCATCREWHRTPALRPVPIGRPWRVLDMLARGIARLRPSDRAQERILNLLVATLATLFAFALARVW